MKLERGLQSTHNLKKATYHMLRKLHSLESRGALKNGQKIGNQYCVSLYLNHLSDSIRQSYKGNNMVDELCQQIDSLSTNIQKNNRVNRFLLVNCLKKHTYVFNWLEYNHVSIDILGTNVKQTWTLHCIPAYICQFKNEI